MAKTNLHEKAIDMRRSGESYTAIKMALGVSKSTLSVWLRGMPLSRERINELRGSSAQRIERCRNTKARKREERNIRVQERVDVDIGTLSDREKLLTGLYLYWGEGSKTIYTRTALSNTDPAMIIFFIEWLTMLGVSKEKLKIYLHLYSDMNPDEEIGYWSSTLKLPLQAFKKPYIKRSYRSDLTYTQRFVHGTCNVIYDNRDMGEYIHAAMKRLRQLSIAAD